jgi:DNA-binding LytR/AlgR family response regulator
VVIPLEEVLCFYSEEKETYLLHHDGKVYLLDASLDKLEEQLEPQLFFRANRKFILTRKMILTVRPGTYGKVAVGLKPASRLPVEIIISREKAAPFRDWLKS